MKHWILAAATLILVQGVDARERRGPPPVCPQPKVDCCPKPKCPPKECKPKPCQDKQECCPKSCDPCCPSVCFERGLPTKPCCTPSAYSEHAAIDLRCGWNVFLTANFIYWEAMQGGMDLAVPAQGTVSGSTLTASTLNQSAVGHAVLQQDFSYKPGFQVGLGWAAPRDNWVVYAEYTWLHGSTSTSAQPPSPGVSSVNGVALPQTPFWIPSSWLSGAFTNYATQSISSEWDYKVDIVDGQISRPFYSGARLIVEPFFGLRGAWIRQTMELEATTFPMSAQTTPSPSREAHYSSFSAGVGPRIGVNGNWHLAWGLRFIGDAAASLLFTGYDVRQNVETPDTSSGNDPFPIKMKIENYNGLRPNLDLSLGLGWGSYFCCRRTYLDLAATYDFSTFWEQNMMRYLADLTVTTTSHRNGSPSSFFLHGLNIRAQFNF